MVSKMLVARVWQKLKKNSTTINFDSKFDRHRLNSKEACTVSTVMKSDCTRYSDKIMLIED